MLLIEEFPDTDPRIEDAQLADRLRTGEAEAPPVKEPSETTHTPFNSQP